MVAAAKLAATLPELVPMVEYGLARWPRTWLVTGAEPDCRTLWDRWTWVFFVKVQYRRSFCEYREHLVQARDGHGASIRLLQELAKDAPEGERILRVELYAVREPLTKEQVLELQQLNGRLRRQQGRGEAA
jgi:hypothetical protein